MIGRLLRTCLAVLSMAALAGGGILGAEPDPGACRGLSHQAAAPRPTGAVAGDRRAGAAGLGELAPDGRFYRSDRL